MPASKWIESARIGKSDFVIIRVKIGSGKNHCWIRYLGRNFEEEPIICMDLESLSIDHLLVLMGKW